MNLLAAASQADPHLVKPSSVGVPRNKDMSGRSQYDGIIADRRFDVD